MLDVHPPQSGSPVSPEPEQERLPAVLPPKQQLIVWQPQRQALGHRRALLVAVLCLFLLIAGSVALVVQGSISAPPSATVTIAPQYRDTQQMLAITTRATRLSSSAVQVSTVLATGRKQQTAARASGKLTFFNIATFPQTIPAGTTIAGKDGVTVITDSAATVLAGNPPKEASVDIPAHATASGPAGNISANDIYLAPCCANFTINGVVVSNSSAFIGGQDAENYLVVAQGDVDTATASLATTLLPKAQDAIRKQVGAALQLYSAPTCTAAAQANPPVGQRAAQVAVTVTESCQALAYDQNAILKKAVGQFTADTLRRSVSGYRLLPPKAHITTLSLRDSNSGMLSCSVLVVGRWLFQFDPGALAHLKQQLAGLSDAQAQAVLQKEPGVRQASIHISNGDTFPTDSKRITLLLAPAP
jgi:hypothetical protein